jgi:hypothetical protein
MQFMLLLHADEKAGMALPKEQWDQGLAMMHAYAEALKKAGAHIAHGALGPSSKATIVDTMGGEMQVHNGPFAETKEQLGGFYLIDVASLDEANQWAAKCPASTWGHIEVRPVSFSD